jgi:hypothetical protein
MSWKRGAAFALTLATIGLSPGVAWGQGRQNSTLIGTVTDDTGARLPGVTVTASSPSLIGGPITSVTDETGTYRFPAVLPGVYEISATLDGFRTVRRTDIRVPLGETVTADVQMQVASVEETITVVGAVSTVDVKSSGAPVNLDDKLLQNLPTGRFQPDIINTVPGVSSSSAFGGETDSNALLMDGVDVSDPGGGTPWAFFNYNWVQEVQIVALGANAEYGEFTGLAANSIIRSGSNRFSGLFEYWTVRPNWVGSNTSSLPADLQEEFAPEEIEAWWDTTAQIGGPILRDKLWFFAGFQFLRENRIPAGAAIANTEDNPRFLTKINWAPSSSVRLEGFFEKDKFDVTGRGAGRFRPPETTIIEPSPEVNWNVRLTWTATNRTLVEVRHGGYDGYFPLDPTPPGTTAGPPPRYDLVTGFYSGNTPYFGRSDRRPLTTTATVTRYVDQFLGQSHEFKFGFEYQNAKVKDLYGFPGNILYLDYDGEPYLAYLYEGYNQQATINRTSLYVQDTWSVNNRLTINPGLRINFNRGSVPTAGNVISTNPIAPRIGLAWDIAGDHKTVVRGHYGRYHDAMLSATFSFMDTDGLSPFITAEVLAPGVFNEIDRVDPDVSFGIDDDISHSYVDQFLAAVEREILPDFSVTAQYIRRNFKNFMAFIDTGSQYEPVSVTDPGPDGEFGTSDDAGTITVFNLLNPGESFKLMTNPDGAFRDYNAFQLLGRKRWSKNWQMLGAYTWSRNFGNIGNTGAANAGFGDSGRNGVFANPNSAINAEGHAAVDPTHEFKVSGTYRVPWFGGFNVSGTYAYRSGQTWARTISSRFEGTLNQGSEEILAEPRGTNRLDAINNLDLRVEKTFPLGSSDRNVGVYFDIFNVTNQGVAITIQNLSGDSFGQPDDWSSPRTLRVGGRITF